MHGFQRLIFTRLALIFWAFKTRLYLHFFPWLQRQRAFLYMQGATLITFYHLLRIIPDSLSECVAEFLDFFFTEASFATTSE